MTFSGDGVVICRAGLQAWTPNTLTMQRHIWAKQWAWPIS